MNKKQKRIRKAIKKTIKNALYLNIGGYMYDEAWVILGRPDPTKKGESAFFVMAPLDPEDMGEEGWYYSEGSMTSPEMCRRYEKEQWNPWRVKHPCVTV